ncbi:MAG: hypothetical protein AAF587_10635 [Bacteroidota bacterium]
MNWQQDFYETAYHRSPHYLEVYRASLPTPYRYASEEELSWMLEETLSGLDPLEVEGFWKNLYSRAKNSLIGVLPSIGGVLAGDLGKKAGEFVKEKLGGKSDAQEEEIKDKAAAELLAFTQTKEFARLLQKQATSSVLNSMISTTVDGKKVRISYLKVITELNRMTTQIMQHIHQNKPTKNNKVSESYDHFLTYSLPASRNMQYLLESAYDEGLEHHFLEEPIYEDWHD